MRRIIHPESHAKSLQAAIKRFGKYEPEGEKRISRASIKENEARKGLLELVKAPFSSKESAVESCPESVIGVYGIYITALWERRKSLRYNSNDVEEISAMAQSIVRLIKNENLPTCGGGVEDILGAYFSALINFGPHKRYRIFTAASDEFSEANCLGYRNEKELEIIGDVGSFLGFGMKRGIVHLHGGFLGGIGEGMEGGEIHLHGETLIEGYTVADCLGGIIDGKVFWKNKQIFPK